MLTVDIFGGLRVTAGDVALEVRGAPRRRVLALLSAHAPEAVSTNQLATCLDPSSSGNPANAVQAHIRRLRRLIEPGVSGSSSLLLPSVGDGYALRPHDMDLWRARSLAQAARAAGPDRAADAAALMGEAVALWGDPWGELGNDPVLETYRWALETQRLAMEDEWATLVVASGEAAEHDDRLVELTRSEPTRETRAVAAMVALFRSGRQSDALRLYDAVRDHLRDELGVSPGPDLERTYLRVLRHDVALKLQPVTVLGHPPVLRTDPLIGRDEDLGVLGDLYRRHQVVSVVGPPGVGKSRLVQHWLRSTCPAHTAIWLAVDRYSSASVMTHQLGDALGVGNSVEVDDRLESVRFSFPSGDVVIVIDGAEAATAAVIELTMSLDPNRANLRFVVTSTTPLDMPGESVLNLQPLRVPAPDESIEGTAAELARDRLGHGASIEQAREAAAASAGIPYVIELTTWAANESIGEVAAEGAGTDAASFEVVDDAIRRSVAFLSPSARSLLDLLSLLPDGLSPDAARWHCERNRLAGVEDPHEHSRSLGELVRAQMADIVQRNNGIRYIGRRQAVDAIRRNLATERACALHEQDAMRFRCLLDGSSRDEPLLPDLEVRRQLLDEPANLLLAVEATEHTAPADYAGMLLGLLPHVARLPQRRVLKALLQRAIDEGPAPEDATRLLIGNIVLEPDMSSVSSRRADLERAAAEADRLGLHPNWAMAANLLLAIAVGWSGELDLAEQRLGVATELAASDWARALVDRYRCVLYLAQGRPEEAVTLGIDAADRLLATGDEVEALGALHFAAVASWSVPEVDTGELLARADAVPGIEGSVFESLLRAEQARFAIETGSPDRADRLRDAAAALEASGALRSANVARCRLGLLQLEEGTPAEARDLLLRAGTALVSLDPARAALAVAGLAVLAARGDFGDANGGDLAALAWRIADAHEATLLDSDTRTLESLLGDRPYHDDHPSGAEVDLAAREVFTMRVDGQ